MRAKFLLKFVILAKRRNAELCVMVWKTTRYAGIPITVGIQLFISCIFFLFINITSRDFNARFPLTYFAAAGEKIWQRNLFLHSFAAEETCSPATVA